MGRSFAAVAGVEERGDKRAIPRYPEQPGARPVTTPPFPFVGCGEPDSAAREFGAHGEHQTTGRGCPGRPSPVRGHGTVPCRTGSLSLGQAGRPRSKDHRASAAPGLSPEPSSGSCPSRRGKQQIRSPHCCLPFSVETAVGHGRPRRPRSGTSAGRDSLTASAPAQFGVRRFRQARARGPRRPCRTRSPRWPGDASADRPPPGASASECS